MTKLHMRNPEATNTENISDGMNYESYRYKLIRMAFFHVELDKNHISLQPLIRFRILKVMFPELCVTNGSTG